MPASCSAPACNMMVSLEKFAFDDLGRSACVIGRARKFRHREITRNADNKVKIGNKGMAGLSFFSIGNLHLTREVCDMHRADPNRAMKNDDMKCLWEQDGDTNFGSISG